MEVFLTDVRAGVCSVRERASERPRALFFVTVPRAFRRKPAVKSVVRTGGCRSAVYFGGGSQIFCFLCQ